MQASHVPVYRDFISHLGINPREVSRIEDIPFLPVSLFKSQKILWEGKKEEVTFLSSGTAGVERSRHFVADAGLYEESFNLGFRKFYGDPSSWCIIALLPSYLERSGSSLIYMCNSLIESTGHPGSGFYLHEYDKLISTLENLRENRQKTLLLGVSFALLDLSEKYRISFPDLTIMETGGMKGRREELLRKELHSAIKNSFGVESVHSEYGMTELLSQAYSRGEGVFHCPPWMKVMPVDTHDPFLPLEPGKTGTLNIIDLANINSCSFIATSDLGKTYPDGSFEVLGRMDNSDIRGCNLLVI